MRLTLALLLPCLLFFTIRRPIAGGVCLLLQLTLVGWLPAAIWAVYALGQFKTDRKLAEVEKRIQAATAAPAEPGEAQNAAAESTEQVAAEPARPADGA